MLQLDICGHLLQAEWIIPDNRPPDNWPDAGNIVIEDFDLKYREGLPLVLKQINCDIQPGEKVIKSPYSLLNPFQPSISMHILHTVLYTFPKVLTKRICLAIKSFSSW